MSILHLSQKGGLAFSVVSKCFLSTSAAVLGQKVAVVLSGCGVFDGTEIHEASACLVHLTRAGVEPVIFAPDIIQRHVINHAKGEPSTTESRNVLTESARIARGKILPLRDLNAVSFDAVVFPGGFGAAKNLSDIALEGGNGKVIPQVEAVLKDFHSLKKPIALCCIAPTLAARAIPNVELTLGQDKDDGSGKWPYSGMAGVVKQWGAVHHNRNVDGVVVDKRNLIVTSPAFMYDTSKFHEIYDGIGNMISELMKLIKK